MKLWQMVIAGGIFTLATCSTVFAWSDTNMRVCSDTSSQSEFCACMNFNVVQGCLDDKHHTLPQNRCKMKYLHFIYKKVKILTSNQSCSGKYPEPPGQSKTVCINHINHYLNRASYSGRGCHIGW